MATTYTSPAGTTVAANQYQTGVNQMNNPVSPPASTQTSQPATMTDLTAYSPEQLGQAQTSAAQQLMAMQTPQARQSYLSTSNIPAMQQNYEDVAQKLFQYDQQLAGAYQTPGTLPSDIYAYGRVAPSTLTQLTPESATQPTNLYNTNPAFESISVAKGKGNLLNLLDSLNTAIEKEFTSRRGQYSSTVKSQLDALSTITDLIRQKTEQATAVRGQDIQKELYVLEKQNSTIKDVRDALNNGEFTDINNPQGALKKAIASFKERLPGTTMTDDEIATALGYDLKSGKTTDEATSGTSTGTDSRLSQIATQKATTAIGGQTAVDDVKESISIVNQIDNVTNDLQKNKRLKDVMGNPVFVTLYNATTNPKNPMKAGYDLMKNTFRLTDSDINTIRQLQAVSLALKSNTIGGKVLAGVLSGANQTPPDIDKSAATNLSLLASVKKQYEDQINTKLAPAGYKDYKTSPFYKATSVTTPQTQAVPSGYIKVRLNDGRTGNIPEANFDPSSMTKI